MDYNPKICIVGLGYVGLPLAVLLSKHFEVIGFDKSSARIEELKNHTDNTNEISTEGLQNSNFFKTANEEDTKDANFYIIAVPTPVTKANNLDLSYVESASSQVGRYLKKGDIVVYESTVYPGVTEDICTPILEKESNLRCGPDFKIGFSPERVNPGDKERTIEKIVKVVSGMDEESLEKISFVYSKIIKAGIHKVSCIKVAEASKVIENTQRDMNIALVNELSIIFDRLGIDTKEVIEAASTKWNFHKYHPGLVGGHCIGVDPYYLIHKSEEAGYSPQVIRAARRINDAMHKHVSTLVIRGLNKAGKSLKNSRILVCGLSFKENINDIRNSRVKELINDLKTYNCKILGCDPYLTNEIIEKQFGIQAVKLEETENFDAMILATAHSQFKEMDLIKLKSKMEENPVIIDIKRVFDKILCEKEGFIYLGL